MNKLQKNSRVLKNKVNEVLRSNNVRCETS